METENDDQTTAADHHDDLGSGWSLSDSLLHTPDEIEALAEVPMTHPPLTGKR